LEEKKQNKMKKMEKKHAGKVKAEFSTSSILKKKFDKDNFEKQHVGKYCSKTKTMWGNIITIHCVLKKKTTKQNRRNLQLLFSITSILKIIKSIKTILKKIMWGNTVAIHSVLKKKTTKINSPAQYEKNKIDKDNSEKKTKKNKKQSCGVTL
jgi:hypothetical protein